MNKDTKGNHSSPSEDSLLRDLKELDGWYVADLRRIQRDRKR